MEFYLHNFAEMGIMDRVRIQGNSNPDFRVYGVEIFTGFKAGF